MSKRLRSPLRGAMRRRSLRPRASQPRLSDVGTPPPSSVSALDLAVDSDETPPPALVGHADELNARPAEGPASVAPMTVVPVTVEPVSADLEALRGAAGAVVASEPTRRPIEQAQIAEPQPSRADAAREAEVEPMPATARERQTLPERALVEETPLPEPVRVAPVVEPLAETQLGMTPPVRVASEAPTPQPVELGSDRDLEARAASAREAAEEHEDGDSDGGRDEDDRVATHHDDRASAAADREDHGSDEADEERAASPDPDRHDDLSLSSQFFRGEEDSLPPLVPEDDLEEPARAMTMSPEAVVRRARFRRVVAGVVGVTALALCAVIGRAALTRTANASVPPPAKAVEVPVVRSEAVKAEEEAARAEAAAKEKALAAEVAKNEEAAKAEAAKADDANKADEAAKADAAKAEETAKADEAAKAEEATKAKAEDAKAAPSGDGKELRKEALNLLNRGKMKDAIPVARAAIAADPAEAMAYLYLGSALQDTGKWKEGVEAYSECVRNATKGPVHECRAMGGRK